ncbi:helix-turn-helix transcriptional regulator [Cupriavidus sp. 2TAF22]|uniref:helix-turn-helix transcriptional regulator n=1 Tax=unclassified Cupriavidus TaxID=2640874 RepID=UPI003F924DC4
MNRDHMSARLLALLGFFPVYQVWDLAQLYQSGGAVHCVAEAVATGVFLWILIMLYRDRQRAGNRLLELQTLSRAHDRAIAERDKPARQSTHHFLQQIQEQFEKWRLTQAEKDIALLLIKGLTLDEIAAVRESRSKTVRQHATNIYAKAGLDGRHHLAAFFLEDLLAPPGAPDVAPGLGVAQPAVAQ